jgi:hypothetical protein
MLIEENVQYRQACVYLYRLICGRPIRLSRAARQAPSTMDYFLLMALSLIGVLASDAPVHAVSVDRNEWIRNAALSAELVNSLTAPTPGTIVVNDDIAAR